MDWYRNATTKTKPDDALGSCSWWPTVVPPMPAPRLPCKAHFYRRHFRITDAMIHWYRNPSSVASKPLPKMAFSLSSKELIASTSNDQSILSLLRGHDSNLLPLIASYCGLAIVLPCSCCSDDPVQVCGVQGIPMRTAVAIPPRKYGEEAGCNKSEWQWSGSIPTRLFCLKDNENFLFQSESILTVGSKAEDRDYHVGRGYGYMCRGYGYIVCTDQGFFSSTWEFPWEDLAAMNITVRNMNFHTRTKRHKYVLELSLSGGGWYMGISETWKLVSSGDDGQQRRWEMVPGTMKRKYEKSYSSRVKFYFSSQSTFQSLLKIIISKRQEAERYQVRRGALTKRWRLLAADGLANNRGATCDTPSTN